MKWTVTITLNFKRKPTTKDVHLKLFDFLMSRKKDYVLIRNNNKENKNER